MKNPHALIIFGQKYDGSNEVSVQIPIATDTDAGCVKPVKKLDTMTQDVGVDADGKLFTKEVEVDAIVTAFSDKPVSSNGVYVYVSNNTQQINNTIAATKTEIEQTSESRYNELREELTTTEQTVEELKTSANSRLEDVSKQIQTVKDSTDSNTTDIESLKTANVDIVKRLDTNEQNIGFNQEDINDMKPKVEALQTDIAEVKSRNIGYFFSSESDLISWISNSENIKNLGVGVCLYITNNTSTHYVWNGTSAERVQILTEVEGGYLVAENPTGTGYISMNNNQTGSFGAVFGQDNIAFSAYSLIGGHGLQTRNDGQAAVGRYNAESKSTEMFTVGAGSDDDNRQTAYAVLSDGSSNSIGDVTAYNTEFGASISVDRSKARRSYYIANMTSSISMNINWDSLIAIVTRNDKDTYTFTYSDDHWNSDSYNFMYVASGETYYYPIDVVGITFTNIDESDDSDGESALTFTDGDTITIYAPLQKTISVREIYNAVNSLGLYVDEDGDVCQED